LKAFFGGIVKLSESSIKIGKKAFLLAVAILGFASCASGPAEFALPSGDVHDVMWYPDPLPRWEPGEERVVSAEAIGMGADRIEVGTISASGQFAGSLPVPRPDNLVSGEELYSEINRRFLVDGYFADSTIAVNRFCADGDFAGIAVSNPAASFAALGLFGTDREFGLVWGKAEITYHRESLTFYVFATKAVTITVLPGRDIRGTMSETALNLRAGWNAIYAWWEYNSPITIASTLHFSTTAEPEGARWIKF